MPLTSALIGSLLILGQQTGELPKAPIPSQVIAKVNGIDVKAADIEDLLWESRGQEILSEFIYYQVAKQEAEKLKLIVTESEILSGIAKEIKNLRSTGNFEGTDEQVVIQSGTSMGRLRLGVKTSLLLTKIAFQNFDATQYIKVSTIIVKPKSFSASDLADAIKVCQSAYDRLKKGEKWETLVDEVVTETQGRQTRGYLGWRLLTAFPEESQKEFNILNKGEYTKPVQTQNGIQIFRIDAKSLDLKAEEKLQMREEIADILRNNAVKRMSGTVKIERLYPEPKKNGS
jgi:parvulin-like peptidyl-prolyl isomerase